MPNVLMQLKELTMSFSILKLVAGDNCFFSATGITDGELLKGVHYDGSGATTQSLVMRSKSGTVRLVNARHRISKLRDYSYIDFE